MIHVLYFSTQVFKLSEKRNSIITSYYLRSKIKQQHKSDHIASKDIFRYAQVRCEHQNTDTIITEIDVL